MSHFRPFLLSLLLLSAPVKAQLWEYIVTSEHGNRYMIDPLSIKRQGNEVSYTQLTNYAKNFLPEPRKIRSIVQYKSNDCEHYKFAITHLIGYEQEDAKGSIVVVEMETKKKWLEVTPGKIADIIHQEICNYKY
jgi:hypothetical protein